ncbi:hypothetical protein HOLleu_24171 [Holothuria leucospilota]|uniref:Uncharacterized protein n=1 Tax=Holothuria leucospilota TaxID=206669 RepID=A0A9Q1H5A0_HOLLE|nr:hypothetical protein HOLleu_24171 [Holothuria leucospilota]
MVVSNALIRFPNQPKNGDISLDLRVKEIITTETDAKLNIDLINFRIQKQDALRRQTSQDPYLEPYVR